MIKVRAHTCYLGKTGYSAHSRNFFRELSKHVDLRIRNYTWDNDTSYLNSTDFSILDKITLSNPDGGYSDYPITHSFPNLPWRNFEKDFNSDVDIVLMDMNHHYFYEDYKSKVKIAFTVWESTEIAKDFFEQLLKFDYLWVVTEWHKKVVVEQGYPKHRVLVVNEGVSDEFFNPLTENDRVPEDYKDGRFKFLFFGRWDYRKAVPEIIDSFLKAFPNNEPVDLILSADNPYSVDGMNSTEERLAHYGFNDERIKVKHFVNREDYVAYLKKGDVMITCARSEGWNIPLIEAMAAGTPVIYSNWGAQLEFAGGKGNPVKISEELPASIGAKLGFAGDTPGLYAEPNYEDLTLVLRDCFNNYVTKKIQALEEAEEIKEKYNWTKIGKDGYDTIVKILGDNTKKPDKKESVVILSHADTDDKLSILKRSILALKKQGYFIILSSHITVPDNVVDLSDYVIIEKDNPIINPEEYRELSNTIPIHFIRNSNFDFSYSFEFNHGYAALRLILSGTNLSKSLGYEITHIVNYDYIIDDESLLDLHSGVLRGGHEVFCYVEFNERSINSGFFSGKTDSLLRSLSGIRSKKDYFKYPEIVILEDFMHAAFEEHGVSMYKRKIWEIAEKNILNNVIVPTYPVISETHKGTVYLTIETETGEHFILVSGNGKKVEGNIIRGSEFIEFVTDPDGDSLFEVSDSDLSKGVYISIPSENKIFEYKEESKKGYITLKNRSIINNIQDKVSSKVYSISFIDGVTVEIRNAGDSTFDVEFIDSDKGICHYRSTLKNNTWARCSIRYYKNWLVKIKNNSTGELFEERINLKDKNVLVSIESSSLGDSIAWFAHVEEFKKKHGCNIYVSTFKNNLFEGNYPDINFIKPGEVVNNLYALYRIGWFYKDDNTINNEVNPRDPKTIPMQATTTDILGLEETSLRPRIVAKESERPIEGDYVCLGMHSTAQAKYWNNPTGWQELTDWFNSQGIKVVMLSLEYDGYMGNNYPKGVITIEEERTFDSTIKYLRHSKMFIGIGSGLSWLSWGLNIPTVIISGFSTPWTEPVDNNIIRIFNPDSCNSCFNRHRLDAGDWNWCPDKKGTPQQFECTKSITGDMVINRIKTFMETGRTGSYTMKKKYTFEEYRDSKTFRYDLINHLIKNNGFKRYLEIGVFKGDNIGKIDIDHKDGVDPGAEGEFSDFTNYAMTSDDYFESISDDVKYDIIFIDGLHHSDQVDKDIENSLKHLNEGGYILLHDCNPPLEDMQRVPRETDFWNGDVWKSVVRLRCTDPNLEINVVDTDWGVGVVRRGSQELYSKVQLSDCLEWNYFDNNRDELLNIISVDEFYKKY